MTPLERMKLRTNEPSEAVLLDCIESAKEAILNRRFPYGATADKKDAYLAEKQDLLYRCAIDIYNKEGAEGQLSHSENGISRTYESSWISAQLLAEITPMCGVVT